MPDAEPYLLDTSAIFCLTDQEDGFERVDGLLRKADRGDFLVAICAVSLMEVYYISLQEQGEDLAAYLISILKAWPIEWAYPDETALLLAGRIKASHRLSFADALIAGVAQLRKAVLVHKDPEFEALAGELKLEALPYKSR